MKPIKFRIPIYEHSIQGVVSFKTFHNYECGQGGFTRHYPRATLNNLIWEDEEQYTCCNDRNGKEVYEGDVIRCDKGYYGFENGVVIFKHGSFGVEGRGEFYELSCFYDDGDDENCEFEVIGNIHQNADELCLLTDPDWEHNV